MPRKAKSRRGKKIVGDGVGEDILKQLAMHLAPAALELVKPLAINVGDYIGSKVKRLINGGSTELSGGSTHLSGDGPECGAIRISGEMFKPSYKKKILIQ